MQPGPGAPPVAPEAAGLPPDARRCSARNRRGERCGRWTAPGKGVCHYHGARSTGARTPEGRAAAVAAATKHGAYARSATYAEALRASHPDLFDTAGAAPDLGSELAFARARLGSLALRGEEVPEEAVCRALDAVRRLAEAQAAHLRAGQAAEATPRPVVPTRLVLEVVNATEARRVVGEGPGHPMDASPGASPAPDAPRRRPE